jgi:hypothetical protein
MSAKSFTTLTRGLFLFSKEKFQGPLYFLDENLVMKRLSRKGEPLKKSLREMVYWLDAT